MQIKRRNTLRCHYLGRGRLILLQTWATLWSRDWDLGGLSLGLKPWDPYSKSQYQSQFLRPNWRVSVSVSNFDTIDQKSRSQSQKISIGLAHPNCFQWFINDLQPHDFLISFKYHTFDPIWALNLCHIKCWCASLIPPIQSLSISLNSWDQSESQSQLLRPKWKVLVSVSIFETIVKVSVSVLTLDTNNQIFSLDFWYPQPKISVSKWKIGLAYPCSAQLLQIMLKISSAMLISSSSVLSSKGILKS